MWYPDLVEQVGQPWDWPDDILTAFVSAPSSESVRILGRFLYESGVPVELAVDILHDYPGGHANDEYVAYIEAMYTMWAGDDATETEIASDKGDTRSDADVVVISDDDIVIISDDDNSTSQVPTTTAAPQNDVMDTVCNPEPRRKSPDMPPITVVEGLSPLQGTTPPTSLNVRPDLTRPDVLARLGQPYVDSLLSRPARDDLEDAWQNLLRRVGPPREWPRDVREAMVADVDNLNPVAVASFAYVNDVPLYHLLQYLEHRPQGVAPSSVERINTLYDMWDNPNRGRQYRAQRFAYSVALKWYVDLNLEASTSPLCQRLNSQLQPSRRQ